MPTRETMLTMRLMESVKDITALLNEILDDPSNSQKAILKRKIKIIEKRLPRMSEEVKVANKKPDPKLITFDSLSDIQE